MHATSSVFQAERRDPDELYAAFERLEEAVAADPHVRAKLVADARGYLVEHPRMLAELYTRLDGRKGPLRPHLREALSASDDRCVDRVVADLRRDGIAYWPSMYEAAVVQRLRDVASLVLERCGSWMHHQASDRYQEWQDPEIRCEHWGSSLTPRTGRTRSFFRPAHRPQFEVVRELMADPRAHAIGARYYDAEPGCNGVLCERLETGEEAQYWHTDGIRDQYKVFVLLTDVASENGPTCYREGTQRRLAEPILWPHLHGTFARAVSGAIPCIRPGHPRRRGGRGSRPGG